MIKKIIKNKSIIFIIFVLVFFSYHGQTFSETTICQSPKPNITVNYLKTGFKKPKKARVVDTILIMSTQASIDNNPYSKDQILKDLQKKKSSTHFLIDREGNIYKLAQETKTAFFSTKERMPDGRNGIENFAIGITLVQKDTDTLTEEQYTSLNSLSIYLASRWQIKNIVSFRGLVADWSVGPYNFDWNKFKASYDANCGSTFKTSVTMFSCPKSNIVEYDQNLRSLTMNALNKSYIPSNLVPMSPIYSEGRMFCTKSDTYEAYKKMREEASITGVLINVNSAFRDASKQNDLYLESKQKGQWNHVAEVGKSEHQLGTAFDFYSGTTPKKFVTTPEYTWMVNNAWKYGFVETYRKETETSLIQNEPWHWRYVGIDEAKKIYESNTSLISYLESKFKK